MSPASETVSSTTTSPVAAVSSGKRVLVATTAMLAFISFWRAAAIVLNDMGSSAFYAGAIAARSVGAGPPGSLGQSFIVETRPGATGTLALELVAKAPADGYTLFVGNVSTNTINENTFAGKLSMKPSRDLVGIAKLVEIPH